MRVHSDILTAADMLTAAIHAGVIMHRLEQKVSRSRDHAWDFYLEGSGVSGGQWGNTGTRGAGAVKAATWDEYGIFIARLYTKDELAHFGKNSYLGGEHFHWMTGERFRSLTPEDQHRRHRWEYQGPSLGNSYIVHTCKTCTALTRRLRHGLTWHEFEGRAS